MIATDAPLLIYTTWPDAGAARGFAHEAVGRGLVACANLAPAIASIYRWEGAVRECVEHPLWLKTTRRATDPLRALLVARHPYETPAFLALPIDSDASWAPYIAWLASEAARGAGASHSLGLSPGPTPA